MQRILFKRNNDEMSAQRKRVLVFLFLRKRKKIAALIAGELAIVEGGIKALNVLRLPKSGTQCVYHDTLIESYKKGARGKGRPLWFPDRVDRNCYEFIVADDSGCALIKAKVNCLIVKGGHKEHGVLDKKGRKRYSARYIKEGDHVKVIGLVSDPLNSRVPCIAMIGPDRKGFLKVIARKGIRRSAFSPEETVVLSQFEGSV